MNEPDPPLHQPKTEPYWLWQTKRLFPNPLFAAIISAASLLVGIIFAGAGINVRGAWPMGIISVVFFAWTYATARAAISQITQPNHDKVKDPEYASRSKPAQKDKPTFAIFVLLIAVYSWLLTIAIHLFDSFVRVGPGSIKYNVTVGIAVASTIFTKFYGQRVIRQHFGDQGGRNLELSFWQAAGVVIFMICGGVYGGWLMS